MTEQLGLFETEEERAALDRAEAAQKWEAQFERAEWVYPEDGATGAKKGDVLLGWVCPSCGMLEPTEFTLEISHGWSVHAPGRVGWCRRPVPKLFATTARGAQAHIAEFREWKYEFGHFDCIRVSHAWVASPMTPTEPTDTCQPTVLHAGLWCHHGGGRNKGCQCVGGGLFWAFCRGCDWEGNDRHDDETAAVFDALDHAHPGWRDSPVVEAASPAAKEKAAGRWIANVHDLYGDRPDGWPIITERMGGLRAVPGRSPWGGYDIAAESLVPE